MFFAKQKTAFAICLCVSFSRVVSGSAGTTVHDKATLAGAFGTPTGTVTFTFFTASSACTGASVGSGTVALDATGVAHPSARHRPLSAAAYSFRAHYNVEDPNYGPAARHCRLLTVPALARTVATELHNATPAVFFSNDAASTELYTPSLHDALPISTGTVTFTFFTASSTCTGTSVGSGTVTLDASGVAH